ncbi:transcriptional regulator, partial [Luteimonas sp. 8-5]|nr:transcriptional regulator [Luteimonas sp. 8-5]
MKQVPRILLVEDDPVTQAYLAAVLEALPATVDAVASAGEAMRAVSG